MRIGIDTGQSSASASEVDADDLSNHLDVTSSTVRGQRRGAAKAEDNLDAATTFKQSPSASVIVLSTKSPESEPSYLSLGPKASSFSRTTTNLERTQAARKVSAGLRSLRSSSTLRAATPRWMREDSPFSQPGKGKGKNVDDFSSDDAESDRSDSLSGTDSADDSEEEQWPVAPGRSSKTEQPSQSNRKLREASVEAQELSGRIRLTGQQDDASLRFRSFTPRRKSQRYDLMRDSPSDSRASPTGFKGVGYDNDLAEVESLLTNMRLRKEEDEKREREAFDARNKSLWDSIEHGIAKAESVRAVAIKAEEDRQRQAKEQREAAERRVKEAKDAEERKAQEAKDAEEKREREKREKDEKAKADAQAANTAKVAQAAEEAKQNSAGGAGDTLVREARQDYDKWYGKIQSIKGTVLPAVSQNAEWRKQCFNAKKIITRGIGQLTNSRMEIERITKSIGDVLTQAKGASPGGEIYTWILNHLSKCLIRQAEQEVAAKQDTAYPLAHVVVWLLLSGHDELGEVLMARLVKKCCWCLPYCPPKKPGEDDAAYAKILGKADKDEASLQHTSRMSGIIAMYFAIAQTPLTPPPSVPTVDAQRIPPHFRLSQLWIWQAQAIAPNMLEHALVPALWSVLLEIAGPVLLMAFGKQTRKMWALLHDEGLKQGKAGFTKVASANSAKVRLQLLLEGWEQKGRLDVATEARVMGP